MQDNARNCLVNGTLPIGYVRGSDGHYALEPVGAEIVREIYKMYADGANVITITEYLNSRGFRTSRGGKWNKNSLRTIVENENYIGIYKWGGNHIEGGVPVIVDRALFDAVQERIKRVARAPAAARTEIDYILTGKLFCGHCGSPMIGVSGFGKLGKKYCYYTCNGNKHGIDCKKKPVSKDWIEKEVVRRTREECLNDRVIKVIVDAAMDLQERESHSDALLALENELAVTKKVIRNIMNAIEQGILTPTTKQRLLELEAKQSELEYAIEDEKIEKPKITREQLTYWLEKFRDGDPDDAEYRSTFIEIFISAVYLYDDHFRVVCNFTKDGNPVSFSFVDGIEADSSAQEVFVFDAERFTIC